MVGIAFHGPMGSGKTTATNYLKNEYGFESFAYADPLKELMSIVQCSTRESLFDNLKPWIASAIFSHAIPFDSDWRTLRGAVWGASLAFVGLNPFPKREFLQYLGTEVCRRLHSSFWVDWLVNRIDGKELVVVDDIRFLNELEALSSRGFQCIKLKVDPKEQFDRLKSRDGSDFDPATLLHSSERELDDGYFHQVWEPDSVENLYLRIDQLVATLSRLELLTTGV